MNQNNELAKAEKVYAAEAIAEAAMNEPSLPPALLEKAGITLDLETIKAREVIGNSIIGRTIGMAVASNMQMREQLETASSVLIREIMQREVDPEDHEAAHKLLDLKIKAGAGIAVLASKHVELTKELVEIASLKAFTDKHKRQKRIAPQVFLGTNYVQNNISPKHVEKQTNQDEN